MKRADIKPGRLSRRERDRQELQALYAMIPTFTCLPGCTECCGPVPWAPAEWESMTDQRRATSLDCPYASRQGCACYEQRPLLCRMFGAVSTPRLRCPFGRRPEVMLTEAQGHEMMGRYLALMEGDL